MKRDPNFCFSFAGEFFKAVKPLKRNREYDLLGKLFQSIAMADLPLLQVRPDLNILHVHAVAGYLTIAAHWFRLANQPDRSSLGALQALLELKQIVQVDQLITTRGHDRNDIWYLLELMGDAAVCVKHEEALGYYRRASAGFHQMARVEQDAVENSYYPGWYIEYVENTFLWEGQWTGPHEYGQGRIARKIKRWLDHSGDDGEY